MTEKLTIEDFTVEHSEQKYGPQMVAVQKGKEHPKYVLRSDVNMDKTGMKSRGGYFLTVHYYSDGKFRSSGDFKGIYEEYDQDKVLQYLVDDLNANAKIEDMEMEIGPLIHELESQLDDLNEVLRPFPRGKISDAIENVEIAFRALISRAHEMRQEFDLE